MKKTVFYCPMFGNYGIRSSSDLKYWKKETLEINPFLDDPVVDLTQQIKLHEKLEYTRCPAWQQISTNSYAAKSPIDLEVHYDKEAHRVSTPKLNQDKFNALIGVDDSSLNQWSGENEIVFLIYIGYLFWTKDKNIWIEQSVFPKTILKNNFEIVEGKFPLSTWTRNTVIGLRLQDFSKPVNINRGDILYYVRFFSDFNKIKLIKEVPSQDILNEYFRNVERKQWLPNSSWEILKQRFYNWKK